MDEPVVIEFSEPPVGDAPTRRRSRRAWGVAGVVVIVAGVAVASGLVADDGDRRPADELERADGPDAPAMSDGEWSAGCYAAAPSAEHLRVVFESVGGFEEMVVAEVAGAFDVVTFDPLDHDRLLAADRAGYGPAEHHDTNQQWIVAGGDVAQSLWDPTTPHDFVHYNTDGTITMWVHSGDDVGYAPRRAVVLDRDGGVVTTTSSMYADRFAVDGGTVFALTGDPRYYAPRDTAYVELLADDGERQRRLAAGADYAWIDVPAPGLLVAYPSSPAGVTAVWDTATLAPLNDHPLAGRRYQRVAIAADRASALAVTFDGRLQPVDLVTGRAGPRFGTVDVTEVDRPMVLSPDGAVAFTVERSGTVSLWFVGDDTPITAYRASSGLPRWLPTSRSAARLTSVLAPDATRLALRIDARPGVGVSWWLVDIGVGSWLERAGRPALASTTAIGTRTSC